ncbi:hypothetical protein [Clostridium akagii]|uniref:hypothetical protein n=1 Tax=Clostridium akagii TaxID=91623 RepID=UPI0012EC13EE|nr:hypothetical protein [Clostridium akagii]
MIEVDREDKALPMLIIKANKLMKWKRICSILIMGLIRESGKQSNNYQSFYKNIPNPKTRRKEMFFHKVIKTNK